MQAGEVHNAPRQQTHLIVQQQPTRFRLVRTYVLVSCIGQVSQDAPLTR